MNRLVLIDGNAILHRAYHALPPMSNDKGDPTNAVYGFVAMLLKVITELKPTHVAVAFDRPKPTFRKQLFKEYQAQRPEMEDQLVSQVKRVHEVLEAMRIPIYEKDGYEADDVIGTIASQALSVKGKGKSVDEVVVMTGDRDLLQLVNNHVKLYMPVKGLGEAKLYGENETEERMGVRPSQIPDFKALAGDASDNYPGVAGIGPKTAGQLLQQFRTVADIYKHLDDISNKSLVEKLERDKENALLSYKLATVVRNVPVIFDLQKAQLNDLLTKAVIEKFGELGFKTLLRRLSEMSRKESLKVTKSVTKKVEEKQMGLF